MTVAQREYLATRGIDPYTLHWGTAAELGMPGFGETEAAILPDGRVLLASGATMPAGSAW